MQLSRRHLMQAAGASALLAGIGRIASAQALDTVRIVNGFPAGSNPDVLARKVADLLAKSGYARAAIVDNKTGAGGQLAVSAVKGMAADGSNVLLTPMSMLGVFPHTYKKLPYDPVADLAPVSMGVLYDYAIGVGPGVPESVKTINDLMAWYKANPTKASMASPSTGSTLHFVVEMLGRAAGVELTHVGYRGAAPAIQDMLGGTMSALCTPLGSFSTYLKDGKIRLLATSGAKRTRFTPNVPTLAEQGFKDLVFSEWYGFYLPAKASPDTVKRLNAALHNALKSPEVAQTLDSFAMEAAPSTPEQLAAALQADLKRWGPIVKSIGFTADS